MTAHNSSSDDVVAESGAPERVYSNGGDSYADEKHGTVDNVYRLAEKLGDRDDGLAPLDDIEYVRDKISSLTVDECKAWLTAFLVDHEYDYNLPETQRAKIKQLIEGPREGQPIDEWELELKTETAVDKFYSPYAEVRAVTTPTDDPSIPCETIRAHFLGLTWAVIAQFTNSLFTSRFPSIGLSSSVIQILLYPCGKLLAFGLPDWGFNWRGERVSLNPGPWTYKEQMLATIIVNVGSGTAYCFLNIQTQTLYYHDTWLTPAYGILLLLSTQLMGLGFAGILRRYVIYPVEAIWPALMPTLVLNRALLVPEKKETIHGWSISRYKLFFLVFTLMFFYFWLPGFLFQALSMFAWMTWIAPNNFNLNMVTGSTLGLGFNPLPTFDWNIIGRSAPLAHPFFSTVQSYIGLFLSGFIILGLYYTNTKWTSYLQINSTGIYDNTGQSYNISRVIDPGTGVLNQTEYSSYSPAFYSAGNLILYGSYFAFYPLTMTFVILDSWRPLLKAYKSMSSAAVTTTKQIVFSIARATKYLLQGKFREAAHELYNMGDDGTSIYDSFDDPITNLLRAYPEVPDWWFLIIAFISFIFAIIILQTWKQLGTPIWTIFFVIALNLIFLIPMTYLSAIAGGTEGLNVLAELICGYALPGHPEAMMFVKAYGYNINGQADNYISDQKMGFYAKVPPRAMYRGQVICTIITALVCYGVVTFSDSSIPGICTPEQRSKFTCNAGSRIYFSASVVWGAIGPKRIFSQIYPGMKYCFLFGFLLAIVWWSAKHHGPRVRSRIKAALPSVLYTPLNLALFVPLSWLKHVHPALIVNGAIGWAPTNLAYSTAGLYFAYFFMYHIKRRYTAWWEKYTYVLSAALDGGVAFAALVIFFALQFYPKYISWWGNDITSATLDTGSGQVARFTDLPAKGYFGPDKWD